EIIVPRPMELSERQEMESSWFFRGKVRTLSVSRLSPAAALGYFAGSVPLSGRHRPARPLLVRDGHGFCHYPRGSAPRRHHHRLPAARRRPRLRGLLALAGPLPLRPLPAGGRRPHRTQGGRAGCPGLGHLGPAQLLGLPTGLPPLPLLRPPP